jgi:signal transduction histidine kinase
MARLTTDLLDLTRGRFVGSLTIDCKAIDLHQVAEQTVSELAEAHPDRDIRFLASDDEAGHFRGHWDPDRMAQLVSNLVANAIQHVHDPIVAELKDLGHTVAIEVRNSGELDHGVAAERLFEPFVTSRGKKRRGLGLGLYIVSQVAKAHGGSVAAESVRGSTIFRVTVPREHRVQASVERDRRSSSIRETRSSKS